MTLHVYTSADYKHAADEYGEYNYKKTVCHVNQSAIYIDLFSNISLSACKSICNNLLPEICSGIFWNRINGSCWLTSYTGDNQFDNDCDMIRHEVVFFRRIRIPCKLLKHNISYIFYYNLMSMLYSK